MEPKSTRRAASRRPRAVNGFSTKAAPSSSSARFSNIRTSRPPQIDLSLFKTFTFREGLALQFRAEAFNFANTPWFGGPNTTAGSAAFGVVTPSQNNDQRNVQLALKLIF